MLLFHRVQLDPTKTDEQSFHGTKQSYFELTSIKKLLVCVENKVSHAFDIITISFVNTLFQTIGVNATHKNIHICKWKT